MATRLDLVFNIKERGAAALGRVANSMRQAGKAMNEAASASTNIQRQRERLRQMRDRRLAGRETFGDRIARRGAIAAVRGRTAFGRALGRTASDFAGLSGGESAAKAMRMLAKGAATAATALTAAGAAIGGVVAGFVKMAKTTADADKRILLLARTLGMTTEEVSSLDYVFSRFGIHFDDVDMALKDLTRNMGAYEGELNKLGIRTRDSTGQILSIRDGFYALADAVALAGTKQEKYAMVDKAMGESGRKLVPVLNQGSKALKQLASEAEKAGFSLDEYLAVNSFNTSTTLDVLGGTILNVKDNFLRQFMPAILRVGQVLQGNLETHIASSTLAMEEFREESQRAADKLALLVESLAGISEVLRIMSGGFTNDMLKQLGFGQIELLNDEWIQMNQELHNIAFAMRNGGIVTEDYAKKLLKSDKATSNLNKQTKDLTSSINALINAQVSAADKATQLLDSLAESRDWDPFSMQGMNDAQNYLENFKAIVQGERLPAPIIEAPLIDMSKVQSPKRMAVVDQASLVALEKMTAGRRAQVLAQEKLVELQRQQKLAQNEVVAAQAAEARLLRDVTRLEEKLAALRDEALYASDEQLKLINVEIDTQKELVDSYRRGLDYLREQRKEAEGKLAAAREEVPIARDERALADFQRTQEIADAQRKAEEDLHALRMANMQRWATFSTSLVGSMTSEIVRLFEKQASAQEQIADAQRALQNTIRAESPFDAASRNLEKVKEQAVSTQDVFKSMGNIIGSVAQQFAEAMFAQAASAIVAEKVKASASAVSAGVAAGGQTAATFGPVAAFVLPGLIGGAISAVMAIINSQMPSFGSGGQMGRFGNKLPGGLQPALLHEGEVVVNRPESRAMQASGGGTEVHLHLGMGAMGSRNRVRQNLRDTIIPALREEEDKLRASNRKRRAR